MRRYGENLVRGQTYKERPGAYGIILDGMDMLLVAEFNKNIGYVDVQMPGGGIDPGESPVQALHREIMEETGYRVAVERRVAQYQRYVYMPEYDMWARKIANIFLCRPIAQIGVPDALTQDLYWAPIGEVPELISNPADSAFLAEADDSCFLFNARLR